MLRHQGHAPPHLGPLLLNFDLLSKNLRRPPRRGRLRSIGFYRPVPQPRFVGLRLLASQHACMVGVLNHAVTTR
jgi:hypothetical protein